MARPTTVLLLSGDPMAAALLGLLAEAAGYRPAFPDVGEPPEEAVARVRPLYVILVDGSLDAVRSDLFFGRAARRRVGLAVLLTGDGDMSLAAWARDRNVPCFDVPVTAGQFARVVDTAHLSSWWRSDGDRRRVPRTENGTDGELVYVDRSGHRWRVYDRRGGDRRQGGDATADGGAERLFIGEGGDAWQCTLRQEELVHRAPTTLERQLARAVRLLHVTTWPERLEPS